MVFQNYIKSLQSVLDQVPMGAVTQLAEAIFEVWQNRRQLFICGNGGSAANALHIANDFLYGVTGNSNGSGIRVEAFTGNASLLTCLANDVGYSDVFSIQLETKSEPKDLLLVLSGSGNSPNIVKALEVANRMGLKTSAILGYSGGRCLDLADIPVHCDIDDMQVSEDLQLVIGHMCMRWVKTQINERPMSQ